MLTRHEGGEPVLAVTKQGHDSLASLGHVCFYQNNSSSPNQGTPIWYWQTNASLYGNYNPVLTFYWDYAFTLGHTQLASMAAYLL